MRKLSHLCVVAACVGLLLLASGCSRDTKRLDRGERQVAGSWREVARADAQGVERPLAPADQKTVWFREDRTTNIRMGRTAKWFRDDDGDLHLMSGGGGGYSTISVEPARFEGERLLIGSPDSVRVFVRE